MAMASTKQRTKRCSNFTNAEEKRLLSLVLKYKDRVENKKADSEANRIKREAWINIEKEFNYVSPDTFRPMATLKKKYENCKKLFRFAMKQNNYSMEHGDIFQLTVDKMMEFKSEDCSTDEDNLDHSYSSLETKEENVDNTQVAQFDEDISSNVDYKISGFKDEDTLKREFFIEEQKLNLEHIRERQRLAIEEQTERLRQMKENHHLHVEEMRLKMQIMKEEHRRRMDLIDSEKRT